MSYIKEINLKLYYLNGRHAVQLRTLKTTSKSEMYWFSSTMEKFVSLLSSQQTTTTFEAFEHEIRSKIYTLTNFDYLDNRKQIKAIQINKRSPKTI